MNLKTSENFYNNLVQKAIKHQKEARQNRLFFV